MKFQISLYVEVIHYLLLQNVRKIGLFLCSVKEAKIKSILAILVRRENLNKFFIAHKNK